MFGADSTSTVFVAGPGPGGLGGSDHHYNFAQKIFQIGRDLIRTLGGSDEPAPMEPQPLPVATPAPASVRRTRPADAGR